MWVQFTPDVGLFRLNLFFPFQLSSVTMYGVLNQIPIGDVSLPIIIKLAAEKVAEISNQRVKTYEAKRFTFQLRMCFEA